MIRKPNFWYKVLATSMANSPLSFEGGICASNAAEALDLVEKMGAAWHVKRIRCMAIHTFKDTVVSEEAVISVTNMAKNDKPPQLPKHKSHEPKAIKAYREASWALALADAPTIYIKSQEK